MAATPALDPLFVEFQSAVVGRYSLERELGRGGMGVVYLAREVRLDRPVAIKLLPPDLAIRAALRERFLREARMAARLSQPNIVPIFSVDEAGDFVFYVMAYVDGETLAQRVAARGPMPPAEAGRILREVAWALAYAHAQGVVHRDIKPDNILLEKGTGRAMVADFGIARLTQAAEMTGVGEVLGTPDFMSPEQASGEGVDGRSDLYSLGVVGFYMLSGKLPFVGRNAGAIMAQHLTTPAAPLATITRGVPAALCQAVDRCLTKDPASRFATGEAMADAIGASMETTRDIPVPVRVFLRRINRSQQSLVSGGLMVTILGLPSLVFAMTSWAGPAGGVLAVAAFVAAAVGVSAAIHVGRARSLLRLGYDVDDVAIATRAELDRRREELAFEYGSPLPKTEGRSWLRLPRMRVTVPVVAVALLAIRYALMPVGPARLNFAGFAAIAFGIVVLVGLFGLRQSMAQRDMMAEFRQRFWSGPIGRVLFKVAGWRLKRTAAVSANRPTELALGSAADAVFHELPKDVRRALGDVPAIIKQLEDRGQRARRHIHDLDRSIAEVGTGRAPAGQGDALVAELRGTREVAHARVVEIISALETIRLDLLRLRAGAGSVESLTADLAAARQVGDHTEKLLAARSEVDAIVDSG